jgi:hypothetical protein
MDTAAAMTRKEHLRRALNVAAGPATAIDLAEIAGVSGRTHETKRRRVREVIEVLRMEGVRICAGFDPTTRELGYWMARDAAEWGCYLEARRRGLRFEFLLVAKVSKAAREKGDGQGDLFGERLEDASRMAGMGGQ